MLNLRKAKYLETVKNNPSQDIFLQGWLNRINNLEKQAEQFAKEERQASEYKERVLSLSSQTQINNKINKNDIISNKIYYYMQKNQDELNKHNPYITDINGDLRKKVYFSNEDVGKMTTEEFMKIEDIINRQLNEGTMNNKKYFENKVKNGEMIWINEYVRSDGTKVQGHYRACN